RRRFLASSSSLGLSLMFAGRAQAQPALVSVTYGNNSPIYAHSAIAFEKGFFKDEGLDLKLVVTDAGSRARQVFAAGEAMFMHNDASQPLALANRGKFCKMILGTQMVCSFANIIVRKELYDNGITSLDALGAWKRPDGARPIIAATAIGSGTWMYGTHILAKLSQGKSVNWVAGGGPKTMLGGLQTNQFDAIMASPGWVLQAEADKFGRVIYDVRKPGLFFKDFGGPVPVCVLSALDETLQKNPKLAQAYVNALLRGMAWMKTAPVEEIVALVGKKYYDGSDPAALRADLTFDRDTWAFDGRISPEDYARGGPIWYRPETEIKPQSYESMVDMRYVEAGLKKIRS
ncbi:MAG: ABC transporter substrate-binding protein, partial [Burkholderiales bacterium]